MTFRVKGLDPSLFTHLYGLSDQALAEYGVTRYRVDASPGYPDRVEMRDLDVGETALLLNYEHLPVNSPYRSSHAIFLREGAETAYDQIGVVPEVMKARVLSLRGIDARGFIVAAYLAEGEGVEKLINQIFANDAVAYIHAHYAVRGCFSGLIERVG